MLGLQGYCGTVFCQLASTSCVVIDAQKSPILERKSLNKTAPHRPRLVKLHASHVLSMDVVMTTGLEMGSHSSDCWKHLFRYVSFNIILCFWNVYFCIMIITHLLTLKPFWGSLPIFTFSPLYLIIIFTVMTKFLTGWSTQKFPKTWSLDSLKFSLGPMDLELLRIFGFIDQALCLEKLLMSIG